MRPFPHRSQYLKHFPVPEELLWLFGVRLSQQYFLVFEKELQDESKDFLQPDQLCLEGLPKIQDFSSI